MTRLAQLETLLSKDPDDPFLRYGIALEHKKAGRLDEALRWLNETLAADPAYCYAWYQQGQVFEILGNADAAREAYKSGLAAARTSGDSHALTEMQAALDLLV